MDPNQNPFLSVVIPTYNRLPILQKCLQALEQQRHARARRSCLACQRLEKLAREYHALPVRHYAATRVRSVDRYRARARDQTRRVPW